MSWLKDQAWGAGRLLGTVSPTEGRRYYAADHLGTPRLACDRCKDAKAQHAYYPFGLEATDPSQDAEPTRFTSQETDLQSTPGQADDLVNMHARFYHPAIARFLSADLLRGDPHSPQSFNLFSYVRGNPKSYWDPFGLYEIAGVTPDPVDTVDWGGEFSEFWYWVYFGGTGGTPWWNGGGGGGASKPKLTPKRFLGLKSIECQLVKMYNANWLDARLHRREVGTWGVFVPGVGPTLWGRFHGTEMTMGMTMPPPSYTIIVLIHSHPPSSAAWPSYPDIQGSLTTTDARGPWPAATMSDTGIWLWDPAANQAQDNGILLFDNSWRSTFADGCQQ